MGGGKIFLVTEAITRADSPIPMSRVKPVQFLLQCPFVAIHPVIFKRVSVCLCLHLTTFYSHNLCWLWRVRDATEVLKLAQKHATWWFATEGHYCLTLPAPTSAQCGDDNLCTDWRAVAASEASAGRSCVTA